MEAILHEISKNKSEITFSRVFIAAFSVIVFFILPCVLIGNSNAFSDQKKTASQTQTTSAKVAGVATTSEEKTSDEIKVPFLNITINLNSQSGLFIIFGLILFTVALILIIYLFTDKTKYRKFKY